MTSLKHKIRVLYESNIWIHRVLFIPISIYSFVYVLIKRSIFERCYSYWYYQTGRVYKNNDLTIGIKTLGKKKTRFPHPIGIVIGTGVTIGTRCVVYQNVTIGAKTQIDANKNLYPKIGDNVVIGCNAIIIGNVTIGDNVVIGAATLVNSHIPDNSVVVGNPFRIIDRQVNVQSI